VLQTNISEIHEIQEILTVEMIIGLAVYVLSYLISNQAKRQFFDNCSRRGRLVVQQVMPSVKHIVWIVHLFQLLESLRVAAEAFFGGDFKL
jgi:Na+-driven multidrug efflux pump